MEEHKTALGISEKMESVLCYAGFFVTGVILLIVEKENKTVRFHALQSFVLFFGLYVIRFIIGYIPVVRFFLSSPLFAVTLVLWILLMYQAYTGRMFKIPVIGDAAYEQVNK